jgi:biotin transport system substrate-specific component
MRNVNVPTVRRSPALPGAEATREGRLLTLLALSLAFAAFTGILAQVRFHLPFTPVPVTGQVFAVLLCGALLGPGFGSLSQLMYVALGTAGIPWFVIGPVGPTGGYLVGFVLAPAIIGSLTRRGEGGFLRPLLAMLAGVAAIYALGLIQFALFTHAGIVEAARLAVLPFVPFDALKALLATLAARALTGKALGGRFRSPAG